MKLFLCNAYTADEDIVDVLVAKSKEEAESKFKKDLDGETSWYSGIYVEEVAPEGYVIQVTRAEEIDRVDALMKHLRSCEFKGFVEVIETGDIYPILKKISASNKVHSYMILKEDEMTHQVSSSKVKEIQKFNWS
jgi:hypothetical protein